MNAVTRIAAAAAAVAAMAATLGFVVAQTAPAPGQPVPELPCKVIPGLGSDDAMVLIDGDASGDRSIDYDNLMMAIRADLADPLRSARDALGRSRDGDREALQTALDQTDEVLKHVARLWGFDVRLETVDEHGAVSNVRERKWEKRNRI